MKNLTVVLRFKVCPTADSTFELPSDGLKCLQHVGSRGNKNLFLNNAPIIWLLIHICTKWKKKKINLNKSQNVCTGHFFCFKTTHTFFYYQCK